MGAAATAVGAAFAAVRIGQFAAGVVEVGRAYESLEARLRVTEGSAEGAAARFNSLTKFAQENSLTIESVVDSYTKLRNLGIAPTEERMLSFTNTASAQGRSVMQFVEAVADAATNEFERLKEFGIKARQEVDTVTFEFQGAETKIAKNSTAIVEYLTAIGNTEFAEANAVQAQTLDRKLQDLSESWRALQASFFEDEGLKAGVDLVTRLVRSATNAVTVLGGLEGIYLQISSRMSRVAADVIEVFGELDSFLYQMRADIAQQLVDMGRTFADSGFVQFFAEWMPGAADNLELFERGLATVEGTIEGLEASSREAQREARNLADNLRDSSDEDMQRAIDLSNQKLGRMAEEIDASGEAARQAKSELDKLLSDDSWWDRVIKHAQEFSKEVQAWRDSFEELEEGSFVEITGGVEKITKTATVGTQELTRSWEDFSQIAVAALDAIDGKFGDIAVSALNAWQAFASEGQKAIGAVAAGLNALGGLLSNAGNFGSEGGGLGATIGGIFGGEKGAALGQGIGSVVGSFIKKGLDDATAFITNELQLISGDNALRAAVASAGDAVTQTLRDLADSIGGELGTFEASIRQRGDEFTVYVLGMAKSFESMDAAVDYLITTLATTDGVLSGASEEVQTALRNTAATTIEALERDLAVALREESLKLGEDRAGIRDFVNDFIRQFEDAVALGLDGSGGLSGLVSSFGDLRNSILGISESVEDRVRRQSEAFEAERMLAIAELRAKEADLTVKQHNLSAEIAITDAQAQLYREQITAQGVWADATLSITQSVASTSVDVAASVGAALQAVQAAIAALEDMAITESDIADAIRRGNRRRRQQQNDLDNVEGRVFGIIGSISHLIDDEELLLDIRRAEAILAVANARLQLEALRSQGLLSDELLAMLERAISAAEDGIDRIGAAIARAMPTGDGTIPQIPGAGGGPGMVGNVPGPGDPGFDGGTTITIDPPPVGNDDYQVIGRDPQDALRAIREVQRFRDELVAMINQAGSSTASGRLTALNEQFRSILERAEQFGVELSLVSDAWNAALDSFREELLAPINALREDILGSADGPLSQRQQLERAQSQFTDLVARLQAGDIDALAELPGVAQALRGTAGDFFGTSSGAFQAIQAQILAALGLADSLQFGGGIGNASGTFAGGGPVDPAEAARLTEQHTLAALNESVEMNNTLRDLLDTSRQQRDVLQQIQLAQVGQVA